MALLLVSYLELVAFGELLFKQPSGSYDGNGKGSINQVRRA
jgi:hypothetical protein